MERPAPTVPTRTRWSPSTRYLVRFSSGMALYVIAVPIGLAMRGADRPAWIPVLLTLPAIALITWGLVAYYRESDELVQRKLGESFTTAFGVGVPVVLTLGLWESFGGPDLTLMVAFVVLMTAWALGAGIAAMRYR